MFYTIQPKDPHKYSFQRSADNLEKKYQILMEFADYLEVGVHDSVRENTSAADWVRGKALRNLGASRRQWLHNLAKKRLLWRVSLATP